MPNYLTPNQLARDLSLRDLTDPDSGDHAIQLLVDVAADALSHAWGCIQRRSPGPRIVTVADNYDNLGFTADAASRDRRYTRYIDEQWMLRSHASAMIPPALRVLAADSVDEVLLVCPGMVFRRDSIDRLHTGTPHQLDLWRISRAPLDNSDMDYMIRLLIEALVPGMAYRAESRVHPYTVDGRQVDVNFSGGVGRGLGMRSRPSRRPGPRRTGGLARPRPGSRSRPVPDAPQGHHRHSPSSLPGSAHRQPDDRSNPLPTGVLDARHHPRPVALGPSRRRRRGAR